MNYKSNHYLKYFHPVVPILLRLWYFIPLVTLLIFLPKIFPYQFLTAFLNPNYLTTRFLNKKISRPTPENFYHIQAFLKDSFIPLSTKRDTIVIFCYALDPSVEKRWSRLQKSLTKLDLTKCYVNNISYSNPGMY